MKNNYQTSYRRGICLLQEVFDVRHSASTKRLWKRQDHVAVLAGNKKITEMIVFLVYRKLKAMLGEGEFKELSREQGDKGKG